MSINEFNILLIDDDEDDFVNIRDLLREIPRAKYQVTWKPSYEEGLKALKTQSFDACLLDYYLGPQTGLELLSETHKLGLVCPIILLTGRGDFEVDLQAMQVGAADYLVKGQLTGPLLERSIRYSIKHVFDMEELKESKAQILLQDRLASLGLLASSLAHEIGTPLGIIRSRAELARRKGRDGNETNKDMEVVISQIDRIAKLVNSLLHLARGKQSEYVSGVSLNQVISDVLNLVQHELDRKNIALETKIDGEHFVMAEAGPLGQVLLNLLVNSIHAIEESRKNGRDGSHCIILSVEVRADSVKVLVKDSGCGISEENLRQLFKPFFTTKDIGLGTGLGLATSYRLVHSWGGSISVESQENAGTTFTISLLKGQAS